MKSCPAKAGPQPEASLARRRVTVAVKRRQRAHGPRDGAPKFDSRVPTLLAWRKATPFPQTGQGETDPSGSESGARAPRSPRNLGGLLPSVEATALVQRRPGPGRAAACDPERAAGRSEENSRATVPVPKVMPKGAETGKEKSESSIVPAKPGNPPQGTRWREGKAGSRNRRRER